MQSKAFPAGRLKNMKSSMQPDTESLGTVLNAEHVHDSKCAHSVTEQGHDHVNEHVHDSKCAHSVTEHGHDHVNERVHDSKCAHSVTEQEIGRASCRERVSRSV